MSDIVFSVFKVQEGLGLGPSGPPIPPSASFCVVPYPRRRKPNLVNEFGAHYVFISNSADDPNAVREEILPKTPEAEVEKPEKRVCKILLNAASPQVRYPVFKASTCRFFQALPLERAWTQSTTKRQ